MRPERLGLADDQVLYGVRHIGRRSLYFIQDDICALYALEIGRPYCQDIAIAGIIQEFRNFFVAAAAPVLRVVIEEGIVRTHFLHIKSDIGGTAERSVCAHQGLLEIGGGLIKFPQPASGRG